MKITSLAKNLIRITPYESVKEQLTKNSTPESWGEESFDLIKDFVYTGLTEKQALTDQYKQRALEIVQHRVAVAGYRIADTIIQVYQVYKDAMIQLHRDPLDVDW